jgi:aryl-alcohol dehydrogenase-like predicted oxidoreductase
MLLVGHGTAIPRKRLGKTGVEVTTVGIGTAWIGTETSPADTMDLQVDDDHAVATLHAALEEGIGLIDTAPLYLGLRSERLVGRALRERPDLAVGVVVETKCCRHVEGRDYSYDAAMRSVQGSLERLGAERIELLYIHDPPKDLVGQVTGPVVRSRRCANCKAKVFSDTSASHRIILTIMRPT